MRWLSKSHLSNTIKIDDTRVVKRFAFLPKKTQDHLVLWLEFVSVFQVRSTFTIYFPNVWMPLDATRINIPYWKTKSYQELT